MSELAITTDLENTVCVVGCFTHAEYTDYGRTVSFAESMADTLLYVHGLAALVLGLRCYRSTGADFVVHVLRSPDGRSTTFSVPPMSVQRLALLCLRRCCVEFQSEKSGAWLPASCGSIFTSFVHARNYNNRFDKGAYRSSDVTDQ